MTKKYGIGLAITLLCVLGVMSVQAIVSIGHDVSVKGTKIEVVGPGPNLQAIINRITDASATKPYLIKLGPGEYSVTTALVMKAFVNIAGHGRGVTILTGAISSASVAESSIVAGADNTSLLDVTVRNTGGGGTFSIAILNVGGSPRIERVTATASGGTVSIGVLNESSSPTMTQVTATASGGTTSYGVYNANSSAEPRIDHSYLQGAKAGIQFHNSGNNTRVTHTRIVGPVLNDPVGTTQCRGNYDENLVAVAC